MKSTKRIRFKRVLGIVLAMVMVITSLALFSVTANAEEYNGFYYQVLRDGTLSIYGYSGNAVDLVIPEKINGKTVTVVSDIFEEDNLNETVETVVIPSTVVQLDSEAFVNCPKLKSITIKGKVKKYNESTFKNLPELTEVNVTSNTGMNVAMDKKTFINCPKLKSVTIPSGVNTLYNQTLYNCPSLERIFVPKTCSYIFRNAFDDVTNPNFKGNITIYSYNSAYAKFFAEENKYPYVDMSTSYSVPSTAKSMKAGATYTRSAKDTDSLYNTTYTSSNSKVAKVSSKGTVTALNKGTATITVKGTSKIYSHISLTYKYKVKVTTAPALSKTSVSVKKGKTTSIKLTGKASKIKNVYTNTSYAKITSKTSATSLTIKGLKKGTTKLKVKVNGVKTLSVKVKVK